MLISWGSTLYKVPHPGTMSFPIGRMYLLISVMSLGLYVTVGTSSGSMHGAVKGRQPPNRDSSAICNEKKPQQHVNYYYAQQCHFGLG